MVVTQIAPRGFREKQAYMFALADKGEQVVIRRKGKISHMLTPVYKNGFDLSPELAGSRGQYREGNVTACTAKGKTWLLSVWVAKTYTVIKQ